MTQRQTIGAGVEALKESLERQVKEILLLYELSGHSNVVTWHDHDVFYMKGKDGLVADIMVRMEYLPTSLAQLLAAEDKLPWERALEILKHCLSGLEHIHSKKIIHRDIKPDNIFIGRDGQSAKIGDFGVARKISENLPAETYTGTPLYMAPEILKNQYGKGYDHRADIYSLGLVAYEMLQGVLPFERECNGDAGCMLERRLKGDEFVLNPSLPWGVRETVMGALAVDPEQRYSSAVVMREALDRALLSDGRETIRPGETFGPFRQPEEKIQFKCPSCKITGTIPAKHAGKTISCKCKERLRIAADGTATIEKSKYSVAAEGIKSSPAKMLSWLKGILKQKRPRKKIIIRQSGKRSAEPKSDSPADNPKQSGESGGLGKSAKQKSSRAGAPPKQGGESGSVGETVVKTTRTIMSYLLGAFALLLITIIILGLILHSCLSNL